MNQYLSILTACPLFQSLTKDQLKQILGCLHATKKSYLADDYLLLAGNQVDTLGIVLEGSVEIIKETVSGNRHIVSILPPSHIFGEGIVCTAKRISPVTVRTRTAVTILWLPYQSILSTCHNSCGFHTQLIYNMMLLLGEKNYTLTHKIDLLMMKGMREKLITFFLYEAQRQNQLKFEIHFNRNELAEYLNVSRPSMSRELARMKEEGLIDYHKNQIHLLDVESLKGELSE